jgi:hypothetical protein
VRADHPAGPGFDVFGAAEVNRLCVWSGSVDGVLLAGGSFDVSHVTAVGNGGDGIERLGPYAGVVSNSISWGNAGANFAGFAAGQLTWSDGSAALSGVDGNIDVPPLLVDEPNGDLALQPGSPCVDAGDPLAERDPDCTRTDMGSSFFDQGGPFTYCTGKVNSLGCRPHVDFVGHASVISSEAFLITANDVVNNKSGLFFYGTTGPKSTPFQGGLKCVAPPFHRTPVQQSGGNPAPNDCSGTYVFDFNARLDAGVDPALFPGVIVNGQFWMRDPLAPFTTGLTDGIDFPVCP